MKIATSTLPTIAFGVLACASAARAQSSDPFDATKSGAPPATWSATPATPSSPGSFLASSWSDDFNRPDAATLGPDWLPQTGSFAVISNQGAAVGSGNQWVRHAHATEPYLTARASIDFHAAPTPQVMYVALVFGVGASSDNVFVKVQDNTADGTFDRVFVYRGINGSALSSPFLFVLANPVTAGRMTVYFTDNGDTVNIEIDSDFDGVPEEVFSGVGLLGANMVLGTNFGVGCFNQPRFDNWVVGQPQPPVVSYCTAGTTTSGCNARIAASDQPSVSFASPCTISVSDVEGQRTGILFYGLAALPQPWCPGGAGSSYLCVKAPTLRSATQSSGGSLGGCDGQLALDWNAFQQANPGGLGWPWNVGDKAFVQAWFRDPLSCRTTSLSDAIEMTYKP